MTLYLLCWEAGRRFGRSSTQEFRGSEQSLPVFVSALLALVAFMLGFTFNMTAARFEDRRSVLIEDVNAIGTAYLRSNLIAEPEKTNIQQLLRQYVETRLPSKEDITLEQRAQRINEIQDAIWRQATAVVQKDRSPITALFIDSLNNMIDTASKRLTIVARHTIPGPVWIAMILLTVMGVTVLGYLNGLFDKHRSPFALVVALTFSVVIYLIADLDRPGKGIIVPNDEGMIELQRSISRVD